MPTRVGRDLLHRWERNPIITPRDVPYRCNTVFNGTPVKLNGEYLMIVRVEGQQGYSFFALARSGDGLHWTVESSPCSIKANNSSRLTINLRPPYTASRGCGTGIRRGNAQG